MSQTIVNSANSKQNGETDRDDKNSWIDSLVLIPRNPVEANRRRAAFEKAAEMQLNQYYPAHTRQELWEFLNTLTWSKYKHETRLPPIRWREEIQLGMLQHIKVFLRTTDRFLYYRSSPTSHSATKTNDADETGTEMDKTSTQTDSDLTAGEEELDEDDDDSSLTESDVEYDEEDCGRVMIKISFSKAQTIPA
jgi:hypothetical protein